MDGASKREHCYHCFYGDVPLKFIEFKAILWDLKLQDKYVNMIWISCNL